MARILIIDDDADIVESMKVVLENKGYEVSFSLGGEDAISRVRDENPDLVILDIMMPEISGFEIARAIKKDPTIKSIPILMLTAIKDKMGISFKEEAGDDDWLPVDDYCEKPLDNKDLISKVEKLLV